MSANLNALALLRQIPMFQSLSQEQLQAVAAQCQPLHFQPGSLVFAQGQAKQGAMIFASGRGVLTQTDASGGETVIGQIRAGQMAGESGLYGDGVEPANLRVVEPAEVLFLSRKRYNQLAAQFPEFRSSIRLNSQRAVPLQPQPGYGVPNYNPDFPFQPGFNNASPASNPDVVDIGIPSESQTVVPQGRFQFMPDKRPDEVLLCVFHPHWWAIVRLLWIPIIMVGVALIIGLLLGKVSGWLGLTVFGIGAILTGLVVVYGYTAWRDDALYVTDQRVLRVRNLIVTFQRRISEIPLTRITGVTWSIPNLDVMARVFDYGSVIVQSSSETSNVSVDFVVNPESVNQTIFSLRDRYTRKNAEASDDAIRADVVRALGLDGADANPQAAASAPDRNNEISLPPQGPVFARTRLMSKNGEVVHRRHWSVWLSHVALPSVIVGVALLIGTIVVGAGGRTELPILALGTFIGVIAGAIWFYLADWDWRNDMLILGKETITLIHRRPMWLQNEVSRVRIIQIDNVVSDIHGLVNTLLDRGSIRISLVGSDQNLLFTKVANPNDIQMEISRRLSLIKRDSEQGSMDRQEEAALKYLQAFYQLTQGGQQTVAMPPVAFAPQTTQPHTPGATVPNAPPGVTFTPGTAPRWSGMPTQPVPPAQPTQPNQPPPPNGDNRPPRVPR